MGNVSNTVQLKHEVRGRALQDKDQGVFRQLEATEKSETED